MRCFAGGRARGGGGGGGGVAQALPARSGCGGATDGAAISGYHPFYSLLRLSPTHPHRHERYGNLYSVHLPPACAYDQAAAGLRTVAAPRWGGLGGGGEAGTPSVRGWAGAGSRMPEAGWACGVWEGKGADGAGVRCARRGQWKAPRPLVLESTNGVGPLKGRRGCYSSSSAGGRACTSWMRAVGMTRCMPP